MPEISHDKRRMTLAEILDKLLIASVAAIFLWFGTRIDNLTNKVENLLLAMATTTEKQGNVEKRIDSVDKRFDKIETSLTEHYVKTRISSGRLANEPDGSLLYRRA